MTMVMMNFLPEIVGREVRARRARRRTGLLALLLLALSMGVGIHSWNSARRAEAAREVTTQLASSADTPALQEVIDRLAFDQSELERALRVTDGLVPSISTASVVATVTHMLPEQMTLHGMRIEAEESPRQLQVMLKGCAANGAALGEFERRLAGCPAFSGVTMSERKASESMGQRVEAFTVSFQVPLDVQIRTPGALRVAMGGGR
jgi:hypothetical protein